MGLARTAEHRAGDFKLQQISRTVWASAKTDYLDALLFVALARATMQLKLKFNVHNSCEHDFTNEDLASTSWAFARTGQTDAELFMMLARTSEHRLSYFNT